MADETPKDDVGELKEELGQLRSDLQELAKTVRNTARDRVRRGMDDLEAQCEETVARGREEIRRHPFTTVMGAGLLGFCMGLLMRRK